MYVRVTVYPGAKKAGLKVIGENRLEIMVREPAEQNLANEKVKELVAAHYGITEKQIRMISGHHSSRKMLSITSAE